MRRIGSLLIILGALVGAIVGVLMLGNVQVAPGTSWLVVVALTKLTLIAAGGLMAGGAVLRRIGLRQEERERLAPPGPGDRAP
jgi:hypothetical protein